MQPTQLKPKHNATVKIVPLDMKILLKKNKWCVFRQLNYIYSKHSFQLVNSALFFFVNQVAVAFIFCTCIDCNLHFANV